MSEPHNGVDPGAVSAEADQSTTQETPRSLDPIVPQRNPTTGVIEHLAEARILADKGWVPIAIHNVGPNGTCSCAKGANCGKSAGKHPVAANWQQTASPEDGLAEIEKLAAKGRRLNLGILTGAPSGFFVLDIDGDRGGFDSMRRLVAGNDKMPATRIVKTGTGGFHYYFQMPTDFDVTNRDALGKAGYDGIDVRGTGGQVVAPPSVSGTGPYAVQSNRDVASAPDWLLGILRPKAPAPPAQVKAAAPVGALAAAHASRQTAHESAYERMVVEAEVMRLTDMTSAATKDGDGYRGEAWDSTTYAVACTLFQLANSPWSTLTVDEAKVLIEGNAPRDTGFDDARVQAKVASALRSTEGKTRPAPVDREDVLFGDSGTPATGEALEGVVESSTEVEGALAREGSGKLTDAALSRRFAGDALVGRFAWLGSRHKWRRWDGKRWAPCEETVVIGAATDYFLSWHAGAAKRHAPVEVLKALSGRLSAAKIEAVVRLARSVVARDAADFDAQPDLLNVGNGIVDLRTGELGPHDPALLLTRCSPTPYAPGAQHNDWEAALQALPNVEVVGHLQERFGQAVTGYPVPDDVNVFLRGGGENGKSTLVAPIGRALGNHCVALSERVLTARDGDHPTEMTELEGARIAILEELPKGARLNVKRLKDLSGVDEIKARKMREDARGFKATHSLFVTTNFMPVVSETDRGTWRRFQLVDFPFTFKKPGELLVVGTDHHGDPGLRERLKQGQGGQHEAILAWIVEGAMRHYAADRVMSPPPPRVVEDTSAWRMSEDRILAYLDARTVFDPKAFVLAADLYADFTAWLDEHGASAWGDRIFSARLKDHDIVREHRIVHSRTGRTTYAETLSYRPGQVLGQPPEKASVWRGLRFQGAHEGIFGA